jgi:hypothetical protein
MRVERLEARLVLRVLAARIQRRAAGEHEAVDQLRTIEGQLKTDRATHAVADKVLKGLAEYLDLSLGDLLEGILLHAFEQKAPFDENTIKVIDQLKQVYGLELGASDSHNLQESDDAEQHD